MAQAAQGLFHGGVSGVRAAIGQGGVRRLGVSEEGSGFGAFPGEGEVFGDRVEVVCGDREDLDDVVYVDGRAGCA